MSTRTLRHRTALAAAAMVAVGAAAAGTGTPAAATPDTASKGTAVSGTGVSGTGVSGKPGMLPAARPPTRQRSLAAAPECLDPVVYTVDAWTVRKTLPTVCIAVGGLVRIANLGPEGLTGVTPANKVHCSYGGGVHACRLIETGTVHFSVTNAQGTRRQTVVVATAATRPRLPDACLGAEVVTRDARDSGMPWSAICMHLNVPMLFTNLGSAGFTVNPADAVDCWDGDEGRYCTPNRTGTVRFTITRPGDDDIVHTVVFVA